MIIRHSLTQANTTGTGTPSSLTTAITVPSGKDRLLLVVVALESSLAGSVSVSSVKFGSYDLARLALAENVNDLARAEIWYLRMPNCATANLVTTLSTNDSFGHAAYVFSNVEQLTTFRTTQTGNGTTGTSSSLTVPSVAADDYVVDVLAISSTFHSAVAGADQTQEFNVEIDTACTFTSSTQAGSAGGVMSHSWTTSGLYAHVATALLATPVEFGRDDNRSVFPKPLLRRN